MSKHHLLWTRHAWNKGYAHKLRRALVYEIPDDVHREMHKAVSPIPQLTESEARELYVKYKQQDHMSVLEAVEWLADNAPNSDFATAMAAQEIYLRCHL